MPSGRQSPNEGRLIEVNSQHWLAALATSVLAWAAIILVSPIALLSLVQLVQTVVELGERVLYYPVATRLPLMVLLITQIALPVLVVATFVSWRNCADGPGTLRTVVLRAVFSRAESSGIHTAAVF